METGPFGRGPGATAGYPNYADARVQTFGPEHDDGTECERMLARSLGTALTQDAVVEFVIKTPHVKCVTHGVVFISLGQGVSTDPTQTDSSDVAVGYRWGGLLWLAERTRPRAGGRFYMPTRAIVGSRAAPQPIPTSPELWGFTFELQSGGEEIYGRLTVPRLDPSGVDLANPNFPLLGVDWRASVRYQSVNPLTDQEWSQLRSKSGVYLLGGEAKALV